jgi:catechol 2,3-dioxygenase-like lactoylglutathione lyase family enzyme
MIDHTGMSVADYETSKAFYLQALAPLGYGLVMEITSYGRYWVTGPLRRRLRLALQ